jgi:hypothetical protein
MSQTANTHPAYEVAALSRRAGVTVLAAAPVLAVMLGTHGMCAGSRWNPGFAGEFAVFGWSHWALLAILVAAGIRLIRGANPPVAAAVALVVAAQFAGAGIVAQHHWRGAAGPGCGYWTNLHLIKTIAILGAVAAGVAVLTLLRVLAVSRRTQAEGISTVGRVSVAVGAFVAVSLPLLLAIGDGDGHDLTSLGAFALAWSLPWGGALALTAWLPRAAAVATGLTVAVSAVSSYPDYDLVRVDHNWVAVLVGVISGLLVAALWSTSEDRTRASQGEQTHR